MHLKWLLWATPRVLPFSYLFIIRRTNTFKKLKLLQYPSCILFHFLLEHNTHQPQNACFYKNCISVKMWKCLRSLRSEMYILLQCGLLKKMSHMPWVHFYKSIAFIKQQHKTHSATIQFSALKYQDEKMYNFFSTAFTKGQINSRIKTHNPTNH